MTIEFRVNNGDLARVEDTMQAGTKRVRRISTIEEWRNKGIITKAEYNAAEMFAADYSTARLLPRFSSSSIGIEGGNGPQSGPEWKIDRSRASYDRVQAALDAVGQRAVPVLVAVVGEGQSLGSFARGGNQAAQARAALLSALHALTLQFGLHNA